MRILIVDDSATMRSIVARYLRQEGLHIEVTEASNGRDALKAFDPDTCELVIADWNMPEMNGLELVRNLHEVLEGRVPARRVPIIMVTTEGGTERVRQAQEAGLDAFLTKPFRPAELAAKVRQVLAAPQDGDGRTLA